MSKKLLFLLILVARSAYAACTGGSDGHTCTAASASLADINAQIAMAADGDTIKVPGTSTLQNGVAVWPDRLNITKAITLIGATTTDSAAGTANDQTIIDSTVTGQGALIQFSNTVQSSYVYRLSGFTFHDVQQASFSKIPYYILFQGDTDNARIDHCHIVQTNGGMGRPIRVTGGVYGVADHNVTEGCLAFFVENGSKNSNDSQGHESWSNPANWSSNKFLFIEDNYVTWAGSSYRGMVDCTNAGKAVIRYNKIIHEMPTAVHGTEGGPATRGMRAQIIYGNTFTYDATSKAAEARSGSVLFYNNTYGPRAPNPLGPEVFREYQSFDNGYYKGATGTNIWDVNDTSGQANNAPSCSNGTCTGVGGYTAGNQPFLYASGTVSSTATVSNTTLLASGNPGWPQHKWIGFVAKNLSTGRLSLILDNDGSSLTLLGNCINAQSNCVPSNPQAQDGTFWYANDGYEIHRVLFALDQMGRGGGDLLKGNAPTGGWPHEQVEPSYSWNNRVGSPTGAHIDIKAGNKTSTLLENRDFYNEVSSGNGQTSPTSPFDGSTNLGGVGWGTFANRPTTGRNGPADLTGVTANPPGTAYWSTNTTGAAGTTTCTPGPNCGTLFVWAGGAWTVNYQPYTYPHPLTVTGPAVTSSSFTFTIGTADNTPGQQIQTSGFSPAPNSYTLTGSWSPSAPTGVNLAPTTGIVSYSGAAATAGTYSRPLTVSNGGGQTVNDTLTVRLNAAQTVPADPTNLLLSNITSNSIDLAWTDNSGGTASGFKIYRSTNNFSGGLGTPIQTQTGTTFSNTGLNANTHYYYRVYAYNSVGNSANPAANDATTAQSGGGVPNPPTGLSAVVNPSKPTTSINLSWTDASNNETGFKILRSNDDVTYAPVTGSPTAANVTTFSDTALSPATKYYYHVLATNTSGDSAYISANATTQGVVGPTPPSVTVTRP